MRQCFSALLGSFLLLTGGLQAQVAVPSSVMGNGGTASAAGGLVVLGTIGQSVIGPADGTPFDASQGFWYTALPQASTGVRELFTAGTAGSRLALLQNVPNPFSAWTEVQIVLPESGHVTLKVYDAVGREVLTLIDGDREAGTITVGLDGAELESGHYTAHLIAGGQSRTITMIVVK